MKKEAVSFFRRLQVDICAGINSCDPAGIFVEDEWSRPGGGGGLTRILKGGEVIERGGVNFSEVYGLTPDYLKRQFPDEKADTFFASGVSVVMHPLNPEVPIIHMNVRFFDFGNIRWFGGGIDLTPHYISGSDAAYFHGELKKVCDQFNADFYPSFKKNADDYFFIRHRDETRGIGGVFFDQLTGSEDFTLDNIFEFVKAIGGAFTPLYAELIERNNKKKFGANEVNWQRLRRGRYVEFNLVYDKGTRFGLETNGRTESILMSLPPLAAWDYDVKPQPGSREAQTLADLRKGIDWIK